MSLGLYLKLGATAIVVLVLAYTHFEAYQSGKNVVLSKLQNDRIKVLKDGKEIDDAADLLDDDGLCAVLGGC